MKISPAMKKQLDDQVALEAAASHSYLAMASWAELAGYPGTASYFYAQSAEERGHMLRIVNYMNTIGAGAVIPKIDKPSVASFKSVEDLVKAALKNEQAVTKAIHKMAQAAQKGGDYATFDFLSWFVKEQVHEEAQFEDILQKFDTIGRDGVAVNEIDKILGARNGGGTGSASPAAPDAP